MLNHSKAWAGALLVATLVVGIVLGAGARAIWAGRAGRPPAPGPERMLASLTDELRLTPAQHDSVGAILRRHWTQMTAVWETVRPRFDSIRTEMDSDVVRQLTPEQAMKYRDHVTRFRHHQEQERQRSGKAQ
jgi:hypothetical protein